MLILALQQTIGRETYSQKCQKVQSSFYVPKLFGILEIVFVSISSAQDVAPSSAILYLLCPDVTVL